MDIVKTRLVAIAALALLAATTGHARSKCEFKSNYGERVAAPGITRLEITAAQGDLKIIGRDTATISVNAEACATHPGMLRKVSWSLERVGDEAHVVARVPRRANEHFAQLDLVISMPLGLDLRIEDNDGMITISDAGAIRLVQHGAGNIRIDNADGQILLQDAAGSIALRGAAHDVDITDGAGKIDIREVFGSVRVTDGSGNMKLRDVRGSVEIKRDTTGDISVSNIGGDFVVRENRSGKIAHSGVKGDVSLPP